MASFQAKTGWERSRNNENKNSCSDQYLPDPLYKIPKKIAKKFKNTIIASFQAKIGQNRTRKRENKNNRSDHFLLDPQQRTPKKQQKNLKNQKISLRLLFKPKQVGKGREREKIKIIGPFHSYTTRNRKFKENSKKVQKIKKIQIGRAHV